MPEQDRKKTTTALWLLNMQLAKFMLTPSKDARISI